MSVLQNAGGVREMFEGIAHRYDLANRVLSLGFDQRWRKRAVAALGEAARGEVVDLCAGTLDLTCLLLRAGALRVDAVDFSEGMLDRGRKKLPPGAPVDLHVADARELPLDDAVAGGVICGFGLRNVPEVGRALDEIHRVLRPGGVLVVLEFFRPETTPARVLHAAYDRVVLPLVGGLLTGRPSAYRYLAGSIDAFLTRRDFEGLCERSALPATGADLFPPVAGIVCARKGVLTD